MEGQDVELVWCNFDPRAVGLTHVLLGRSQITTSAFAEVRFRHDGL